MKRIISPVQNRLYYIASSLRERMHGLDFTMPDRMYDRHRHDGAMYYASTPSVLRAVFAYTDTSRYDSLLDVGCGKGYVLKTAAEYGFKRIGGIEYDEKLSSICAKNMRATGLNDRVRITCGNASSFDRYGEYNCFYFYNPFMPAVMETVIRAICDQCRGRDIMIVYYHPRYPEPIENSGYFHKTKTFYDHTKNYEIYVYQGVIGKS